MENNSNDPFVKCAIHADADIVRWKFSLFSHQTWMKLNEYNNNNAKKNTQKQVKCIFAIHSESVWAEDKE